MSHLKPEHRAKGSLVLVYIFLAVFAMFYYLNWKYLAGIWKVG